MKRKIIIGTRGSKLALWQAYFTKSKLEAVGFEVELHIITTKGDRIQHLSFNKIEGKGFFTKEIEDALLRKEVDLAVHSFKDLPTENPPGLTIAANSYREDAADWLVINPDAVDRSRPLQLKNGTVVGTSSARRKAQILAMQPHVQIKDIRGNVPTRIRKLAEGWDAIVLAAAGLRRLDLDLSNYHVVQLKPQQMVAAAAQGVLAFQIREDDAYMHEVVQHLHDAEAAKTLQVEREILQKLGGGCHQPIGVHCRQTSDGQYQVWALQAKEWNGFPKRIFIQAADRDKIVEQVLTELANHTAKTVFISRQLKPDSYFKRAIEGQGSKVYDLSLLQLVAQPLNGFPSTEWIFFTSKNGVRYFFDQSPRLKENTKIAAIGPATAQTIRKYGHRPAYIGKGIDSSNIAREFMQIAENQHVLMPQARHAVVKVSNIIAQKAHVHPLPVYNNKPLVQFDIPVCDLLVFTSPMNVQTYFGKYEWQPHQKIIAIGKTTGEALTTLGITDYKLPYAPDEVSLADVCW